MWGVGRGLGPGSGGVGYVCVSPDSLCRWQVQVIYRARRIPAHFRCTKCSILLYLIYAYGRYCISLLVGPGFVSTSPTLMRSGVGHPSSVTAWPGCQKAVNRAERFGDNLQFVTDMTTPPLVCCVVWRQNIVCD